MPVTIQLRPFAVILNSNFVSRWGQLQLFLLTCSRPYSCSNNTPSSYCLNDGTVTGFLCSRFAYLCFCGIDSRWCGLYSYSLLTCATSFVVIPGTPFPFRTLITASSPCEACKSVPIQIDEACKLISFLFFFFPVRSAYTLLH